MNALHNPWLLLTLLLVPLLVWLHYGVRRRSTIRYSNNRLLRRMPKSFALRIHRFLPVLYVLGIAALAVALSRPRFGEEESKVKTDVVDIVLLVDLSTSMRALDFSTKTEQRNRLDAAKEVLERFIDRRPEDRLALVAFAAVSYTAAPLTTDHPWLAQRLGQLKTGMLEDGTAIGTAIASAVNRLRDSEAESKLVVLLTDGVNTAGDLSPENAARLAEALGIKVYTIGAGREGYVPAPGPFGRITRQHSEIDEAVLERIAEITGGRFFRADNFEALDEVYKEIDALERTEIEVEQFTRYEERFTWLAFAALALLLTERLASLGRFGSLTE